MNYPKEEILEKYLRYPEKMSREELDYAEGSLKLSTECRKIYSWLKSYYTELDQLKLQQALPVKLFRKDVAGIPREKIVLAADQEGVHHQKLSAISTLISKESNFVLRVLSDSVQNSLQIHLIPSQNTTDKPYLINFGKGQTAFITDKYGKVNGISVSRYPELAQAEAIVQAPLYSFSVSFSDEVRSFKKYVISGELSIQLSGDSLRVQGAPSDQDDVKLYSYLLIRQGNSENLYRSSDKVDFRFTGKELTQVYLFR